MLAAACRTPFVGIDGALAGRHPVDLSALVMNEVVRRGGVAAEAGAAAEVVGAGRAAEGLRLVVDGVPAAADDGRIATVSAG